MKKKFAIAFSSFFLVVLLALAAMPAQAQCAMCKSSVESNQNATDTAKLEKFGNGLNKGILYIMMAPYILVGTVGFFWYRNRRKNQ